MSNRRRPAPAPAAPPVEGKHIAYDRMTRDYCMKLDGMFIGYAATYYDAEQRLNELARETAWRTVVETADTAAEIAALQEA